jgi:ribosomal protein L31
MAESISFVVKTNIRIGKSKLIKVDVKTVNDPPFIGTQEALSRHPTTKKFNRRVEQIKKISYIKTK